MKYKIEKKHNPNATKYKKDDLDLTIAFSKLAYEELKEIIKGIILFGSAAKTELVNPTDEEKDIDILILLDDISVDINKEITEAYRIITAKMVAKVSSRIHVTTLKLSTFWDLSRNGDPVAINILRDGVAIIDTGFFDPLQALLMKGKIKPSYESIWTYYNKANSTITNSRARLIDATVDLYWGVIDSTHAALMKAGCIPPSPSQAADYIEEKLVKTKLCDRRYADNMRFFYGVYKEITHRKIQDISGNDYEKYYAKAKDHVEKMRQIITHFEKLN
jgi:predicted nucleotidyltransferase